MFPKAQEDILECIVCPQDIYFTVKMSKETRTYLHLSSKKNPDR